MENYGQTILCQIKSNHITHLFVSVASIARFHSAIDKISAMKTIK